ncbi:MAG TPA: serine hydrolase, partial [Acidothermales bacterium]
MRALEAVRDWPVDTVAVGIVAADGHVLGEYGPQEHVFELASVTKLLTAYAALIAVEEGALGLDAPAGPPESTIRHLLAHASG